MEGEKGRKGRINVVEIGYYQYYGMNGMVESGNDNDYYTKFYVIYKKIDKHNTNIIIKTIPVVFENNISALLFSLFSLFLPS